MRDAKLPFHAARALAGALATSMLMACASMRVAHEAPPPVPLLPPNGHVSPPALVQSEGSLWVHGQSASLWSDPIAQDLYDIVFVNVIQNVTAEMEADTNLERTSSLDYGISNLLGRENEWDTINDGDATTGVDPSHLIRANSTNDFEGQTDTSRTATLAARISAQVVEVFPNGNLRLYGTQVVSLNQENQLLTVEGIARPLDIGPDNSIDSYLLAEARIEYTGRGVMSDHQRPGWGARVLSWVWPF